MTVTTINEAIETCIANIGHQLTDNNHVVALTTMVESVKEQSAHINPHTFNAVVNVDAPYSVVSTVLVYKDHNTRLFSMRFTTFNTIDDKAKWNVAAEAYTSTEIVLVDYKEVNDFNMKVVQSIAESLMMKAIMASPQYRRNAKTIIEVITLDIKHGIQDLVRDVYAKEYRSFDVQGGRVSFHIDLDSTESELSVRLNENEEVRIKNNYYLSNY